MSWSYSGYRSVRFQVKAVFSFGHPSDERETIRHKSSENHTTVKGGKTVGFQSDRRGGNVKYVH